ncbi:MAG: hypothetical protein M0011_12985 [Elusimicrobia bacterium]|nr:hypothetical protein [Elusimicrobiota bacterium]
MTKYPRNRRAGQMAISMVISILLFLMLMFPVMNLFVQNEGKWSVKEKQSTTAFHLAEAGADRAYWKVLESVDMWNITSTGTIPGYNFDQAYEDIGGGSYAVKISSDPVNPDRRIVEAVGRDGTGSQLRSVRMYLENTDTGVDSAVRTEDEAELGGGNSQVEWGPVVSYKEIKASGRTFPRYYSAGHVTPQDGGSAVAGTDDVYWWSFYPVPPAPAVSFSFYLSSAQASGASPCGGNYYTVGNRTFMGCHDKSGKTYYVTGNVIFKAGGGGNHITGTVMTLGNVEFSGNGGSSNGADGSYSANIPPYAWREYGANWAHYKTFDPAAPATWADAVSSNYVATGKTYPLSGVLVHGFLYARGEMSLQGGGNGVFHGLVMTAGEFETETSNYTVYYDSLVAEAVKLSAGHLTISKKNWYEIKAEWPAGLP